MRMLRIAVLAAALPVLAAGCAAVSVTGLASDGPVRAPYAGTWELVAPGFGPDVREVKHIGARRFSWNTWNDATHELLSAGGGTCRLAGGHYVETLEYARGGTEDIVGRPLRFTLEVRGDTLLQRGVPGGGLDDLREVWRRVK